MVEAATQEQAESVADRLAMAVADACGAVAETEPGDR
jgi:hypothetical protein